MTYNKPEVVKFEGLTAIQSAISKSQHVVTDSNPLSTVLATPQAYEADE